MPKFRVWAPCEWRASLIASVALIVTTPSMAEGWYIAPDFTLTHLDSDAYEGSESSLGFSVGRRFTGGTDAELSFSQQKAEFKNIPDRVRRREILFGGRWAPSYDDTPNLFLSGGVGGAQLEYLNDDFFAPTAFVGLGYKLQLSRAFDVLAEGRLRYSRVDESPSQKDTIDSQAMLKIRYTFSSPPSLPLPADDATGHPLSPAATERTNVAGDTCASLPRDSAAFRGRGCETSNDIDGDGVLDTRDLCASTIPGVAVDVEGCMIRRSTPTP